MKKPISIFSILSLCIGIIATVMFWLLLGKATGSVYVPWIFFGTISIFLPILSKYFRVKSNQGGKGLEITALILGFYNFWWILGTKTEIDGLLLCVLCAIPCVLYAKLFNNINANSKESDNSEIEITSTKEITKKKNTLKDLVIVAFVISSLCILFLIVDSAIVTSEPDLYCNWSLILGFYIIPIILFCINRKINNAIIAIINFCIMTFYAVMAGIMTDVGEAFDYSVEGVVAFYILLFVTFLLVILFLISIFKAKWNLDFYYNSIWYKEKCYKKVAKIKRYLDNGIITEDEFEANKQEILKKVKPIK